MAADGVRANGRLVVLTCLAMALGFAWFDIPGNCSAFIARDTLLSEVLLDGHTLYLLGMFVTVAAMAAWPRVLEEHPGRFIVACLVLGSGANALYCLAEPMGLVAAAVLLMGLLDVLFINLTAVATLPYIADRRAQGLCVIFALALKTLVSYLVDCLPGHALQMGSFIALPLLGGTLALAAMREVGQPDRDVAAARLKFAFPLSAIMLGILLLSSVVFAATRVVSNLGFWGAGYALAQASPASCALLTLVFLALSHLTLVRVDSRLLFRFMPALLVLFALYALVYTGLGESAGIPAATLALISQYSELYGQAFAWSVNLLAMRTLRMPAARVLGVQFGLFVVVELLLQRFLLATGQGSLAVVLFAFFAALAALVWALCHFDGRRDDMREGARTALGEIEVEVEGAGSGRKVAAWKGDDASTPPGAAEKGALAKVAPPGCDVHASPQDPRLAMAAAHGLTPRETEVFLLLAQGRSRRFICDELFIADGTASTYVSRVYDKFGVHSKQELLSVVLANAAVAD